MTFAEQIAVDLRNALKAGEKMRVATLRLLVAQIMNQKIALKTDELSVEETLKIVQREIKKRREAAEGFMRGARKADAEREDEERKILEAYVPQQLSDAELEKIARETIAAEGNLPLHAGKITGKVMEKVRGIAEGGRVKTMVEKLISGL